jgi:adenylate cyclase
VSARVQEDAAGRLDLAFEDVGEQRLKNIARPVRVFRVSIAEMAAARRPLPLPDKPSLAVLPFQNLSRDPEQEYFVDGVVEEIITAISRLPWLFVIARNSSFAYKGKSPDLRQVGRELGVRYVLEGSLRKAGNRVRITGQLIDTTVGAHIWADRFDGALDDIFELQDQVASNVVGAIEPKLRQSEVERAVRKRTASLTAYDLYLRALGRLHKNTEEDIGEAVALLKRALALDPSYAPPAALIAWCRVFQRVQQWGRVSDADVAEAVALARRALEAGKDDPDTLWMGGAAISALAGDMATAEGAVERALLLNPNSAYAWMARGWVSYYQNRPGPALDACERAMRLSPLDPLGYLFTALLAFAHTIAGRYEEALAWVDRSLREQPRHRATVNLQVILYALLGRTDDARRSLGRLQEIVYGLTIANYREFLAPQLAPEILALYVEALRKAGLPEE